MVMVSTAEALRLAVAVSLMLVLVTALQFVVSVPIQLFFIRLTLRGKPQPDWDAWCEVLRAGPEAMGLVQSLVIRMTLPLGKRWWPPVSGGSDGGSVSPPARS